MRRVEPSRRAAPSKPVPSDKGRRQGDRGQGGGGARANPHDNKPVKGKGNNKVGEGDGLSSLAGAGGGN